MKIPRFCLVLVTALASVAPGVAASQAQSLPQPGELGYQPPEVLNVLVADAIPHQETSGGSQQLLLGLSGAPGRGFGAVWRDTRDGTIGLYFARLDVEGKTLEPERSICSPHTMRRTDAVVTLVARRSCGCAADVSRGSTCRATAIRTARRPISIRRNLRPRPE